MNLRLISLELNNYRLYKGYTKLLFGAEDSKNVTIVLGKNGAGKSTLLNALSWCFYGTEPHTDSSKRDDSMPIINTTVLKDLYDGESTTAEVTLTLEIDGHTSQISRLVSATKYGSQISFSPTEFSVRITDDRLQTETYHDKDAKNYIEGIMPEALSNFFLIDGEQLRVFFQMSTPEKIEEAIDKLSRLDVIQSAITSLKKYSSELTSKCKPTDPIIEEIKSKSADVDKLISISEDKIQDLKRKISKLTKEKEEVELYLTENNNEEIAKISTFRKSKEEELKNLERQYNKLVEERNCYLARIAPFIYMKDILDGAFNVLNGMVERGELPEKVREIFIDDLLNGKYCICGNEIGDKERQHLQAYAKKMRRSGLGDIAIQGRLLIKQILDDIADFPEIITEKDEEVESISRRKETVNEDISQANSELQGYDEVEIKRKNNERLELLKEITVSSSDLSKLTDLLERKETEKRKLESNLQAALQKDAAQKTIAKKLNLAKRTKDILRDIEFEVKKRIRKLLETNTEKTFLSLERKKAAFKSVSIDDKYNVFVQHKDGYNALTNLSAGEYLLLGLSFMYALRSISGYLMPVIIDTPLGKIDDEHRDNITQQLPQLLYGSQLILLVTPTEYDPKVRENLSKFVSNGAGYEIKENEDKTAASLEVMI